MKINTSDLVRLAERGTVQEYVQSLRDKGPALLEQALDHYIHSPSSTLESQAILAGMLDVKNSLLVHCQRFDRETYQNFKAVCELEGQVKSGNHPTLKLEGASREELEMAESILDGKVYPRLSRETSAEEVSRFVPACFPASGVKNFLSDFSWLQAAYASATLTPGGATIAALVPMLGELRERLCQARVEPANEAALRAKKRVREWALPAWFGFARRIEGYEDRSRIMTVIPHQPERLRLPLSSTSDVTG